MDWFARVKGVRMQLCELGPDGGKLELKNKLVYLKTDPTEPNQNKSSWCWAWVIQAIENVLIDGLSSENYFWYIGILALCFLDEATVNEGLKRGYFLSLHCSKNFEDTKIN